MNLINKCTVFFQNHSLLLLGQYPPKYTSLPQALLSHFLGSIQTVLNHPR